MNTLMFATVIWQVTDWLKELRSWSTNRSAVITQAVAWLVGIAAVWLGHTADAVQSLVLPGTDQPLSALDGGSIVLVGIIAASVASSLVDTKKALDNSDSAAKPPLIQG